METKELIEYLKDAIFLGYTKDGKSSEYFKDGKKWTVTDRREINNAKI